MTWRGTARIEAPLALLRPGTIAGLWTSEPVLSGPKAFILHLERASSRAATVQSLRASMAIESEVLGAVDGARLTPQEVDQAYARRRFRPTYPFPLTRTEVGVFLSHRLAWRRIVDDALDFAFIFEDDAEIDPSRFAALVEFVDPRTAGLGLRAAAGSADPKRDAVASRGGLYAHAPGRAAPKSDRPDRLARPPPSASSIARCPSTAPSTRSMQMTWVTGQPLLVASPSPVRDVSRETGGSTVQRKSMSLVERLRHEAMRPIYRAQVLARYRRDLKQASL